MLKAAEAARRGGAREVLARVAHGLFMEGSEAAVTHPAINSVLFGQTDHLPRVITTDSVPPFRVKPGPMRNEVEVSTSAPLLAEAISRLHGEQPLSDLLVF